MRAVELAELGTPADRITTRLDTSAQLAGRRRAMAAHVSETSPDDGLSSELADAFLGTDNLIRIA